MGLLNGALYSMTFDAATVARIGALVNALPVFEGYYLAAMRACVSRVSATAMRNAPVLTGTLRRGIRAGTVTPWVGQVGVISAVPYARRREFGFDNRTDRLGRKFANGDPLFTNTDKRSHMFYLKRALEAEQPFIAATFRSSTTLAIRAVAGI